MNTFAALLIPLLLAGTALIALHRRIDVYDALTAGAMDGLRVTVRIFPALVGLLSAVWMLRASGAMELAAHLLSPLLLRVGLPPETVALMLVRPVSGSGALAVGAELIARYFHKGSCICIVGTLQQNNWTDQQGNKRYSVEIVADEANFVDAKNEAPAAVQQAAAAQQAGYMPENYGVPSYSNAGETPKFDEIADYEELPF